METISEGLTFLFITAHIFPFQKIIEEIRIRTILLPPSFPTTADLIFDVQV